MKIFRRKPSEVDLGENDILVDLLTDLVQVSLIQALDLKALE